jgi:sporulation protein YlmC with PRC-barrel domain
MQHSLGKVVPKFTVTGLDHPACRPYVKASTGEKTSRYIGGQMLKSRYPKVLSSSTISSDHVKNAAGEDLGKIEDLMIDLESGRVAYAVLSFGGFLKMGNKLFAIPWQALKADTVNKQFILNVDKTVLENATGFDKDNWPDMADPTFGSNLYRHYGYKPYWEDAA